MDSRWRKDSGNFTWVEESGGRHVEGNTEGKLTLFPSPQIRIPVKLTEEQRTLITAFAQLDNTTQGTVNGLTSDKKGSYKIDRHAKSSEVRARGTARSDRARIVPHV